MISRKQASATTRLTPQRGSGDPQPGAAIYRKIRILRSSGPALFRSGPAPLPGVQPWRRRLHNSVAMSPTAMATP